MKYLFDTCILIDLLRKNSQALEYIETISSQPFISVITLTELYAGVRNKKEKLIIARFLESFELLPVSQEISEKAGEYMNQFYKSHHVEIADSLIAATSKIHNLEMITLNTKHFPMFSEMKKPY